MVKVTKNFSEVRYIKVTYSRLDNLQKFLERVLTAGDCEKPNIELVLKTTSGNTQNHGIVK